MRVKRFYKKMLISSAVLIASFNLVACGNIQNYDEEIEKGIGRMVEDRELIDVATMEEFDKQVAVLIEDTDLSSIFEEGETVDLEESQKSEKAEVADFVESDGPDTIVIDGFTYYKIGKEYKPGEYVMVANEGDSAAYSVIMDDEEHTLILSDSTEGYAVFDTLEGQYIKFDRGQIYPIDEAPEIKKTVDGAYPEGTYKAGVQIPAGEYVAKGDYPSLSTYVGLSYNDTSVGFCSNARSAIITVNDGQYIEAKWGDLYPLEITTNLKPADGIYKEGTYKVGFHMPAGTYQLKANVDRAYVDIYNNGYMVGRGDEFIVSEPETTFTVSDGQFVVIVGGEASAQYEFIYVQHFK